MNGEVLGLIQACEWVTSRQYIVSSNVFDPLVYYSHIGAVIPTVLLALFIYINGKRERTEGLLLAMVSAFSLWVFSDLVLWATEFPERTMFFWTVLNTVEPLVYFLAFYFFYSFAFGKDLSLKKKLLFSSPLLITFIFAPTSLMLLGYDLYNCDRAATEGILAMYGYVIEILYVFLILFYATKSFLYDKTSETRLKTLLLAMGTCLFLISFSLGNIIEVFTENWYIGQIGLLGAPIFTALLSYLIIKYRAFNLKLIGAQVFVAALWILIFSILFINEIEIVRIVISVTLIFVLFLGILLIRGVSREINQRTKIELLATSLEAANKQQITLIHFITHQLKGFVSKSRNIFATMQEGDYGDVPAEMKPIIEEGFNSATKGAQTIQEILNAANIRSGKVAFASHPFDLSALARSVVLAQKPMATQKGVSLTYTEPTQHILFVGDQMQMENALKNMVDNSIKYTPAGSIGVTLEKIANSIRLTITDTGVGITQEDMAHLFTEGGHGKESQRVNVDSTGFGLYIVKNIIDMHGGSVWAESEGAGKGSTFIIELPT